MIVPLLSVPFNPSTNTVESSANKEPLTSPTSVPVKVVASTLPANVPSPAFTAFDVALKNDELSVASTSPLNVPDAFKAPVALLSKTVESSAIILALTLIALTSLATWIVLNHP